MPRPRVRARRQPRRTCVELPAGSHGLRAFTVESSARQVLGSGSMQKLRTEPSLSTVALTVILWTTLGVGLIMIMVVLLRS